jgi:hypothetical protein
MPERPRKFNQAIGHKDNVKTTTSERPQRLGNAITKPNNTSLSQISIHTPHPIGALVGAVFDHDPGENDDADGTEREIVDEIGPRSLFETLPGRKVSGINVSPHQRQREPGETKHEPVQRAPGGKQKSVRDEEERRIAVVGFLLRQTLAVYRLR